MSYLFLKLLHVIAVILFLGNIVTGLFWKAHADRSGDPRVIAHAFEGIIRSDRWFTIPGVVVIIITGVAAAVVFMFWVAPLQVRILTLARAAGQNGQFDWPVYRKFSHVWEFWGLVAMLTPAVAVVLMVLKPELPAL